MAVKSPLRPVAKRLAASIRAYAASRGWLPGDLAIAGTFDERAEQITLEVGTDRKIDEKEWYTGILNRLRVDFATSPWVVHRVILLVRNVDNLDGVYGNLLLGDDEIDITEYLE